MNVPSPQGPMPLQRIAHGPCSSYRINPVFLTVLFLVFSVIAGSSASVVEHIRIDPQQVISNALAHSHSVRLLEKESDVAAARQKQAWASGLPSLSADARASFYTPIEDSVLGSGMVIPGIENRYGAGVGLSQPVFTGGRIRQAKEGAAHQRQAALFNQQSVESDVVLQALNAYWSWSKAYYLLESVQAAVRRIEAHALDVNHQHRAGLATDNDKLAADVLLEKTRLRLEETKRRVGVSGARITYLTGLAWNPAFLPEKATSQTNLDLMSEPMLLEIALANRSEKAALQREVLAAQSAVKSARAEYYPQVSALARYESSRPNLLIIPPQDRWVDDGFAGVTMSWNIFDWGLRRAKVAEASARAGEAQARLDQTEEEIALQVREARINLQDALDRIAVAQRVEQSAFRNLEVATALWKNGLSRHSDVLDAHAQLTDAQFELTATHADLELASAALDHATGLILRGASPRDKCGIAP